MSPNRATDTAVTGYRNNSRRKSRRTRPKLSGSARTSVSPSNESKLVATSVAPSNRDNTVNSNETRWNTNLPVAHGETVASNRSFRPVVGPIKVGLESNATKVRPIYREKANIRPVPSSGSSPTTGAEPSPKNVANESNPPSPAKSYSTSVSPVVSLGAGTLERPSTRTVYNSW